MTKTYMAILYKKDEDTTTVAQSFNSIAKFKFIFGAVLSYKMFEVFFNPLWTKLFFRRFSGHDLR